MKCITCGQTLSLRMTRCSTCGTPASYTTTSSPQSSSTQNEQQSYVQFSQSNSAPQVHSTTYPPIQQEYSANFGLLQGHALSSSPAYLHSPVDIASMKRRYKRNFFLLAIVVCVLLLFAIGSYKLVRVASATNITKQANTPSNNAIVPTASLILKHAQTSSDIDTTLAPTRLTKTFMANQKIYVTFTITSGTQDGSIEAKWYTNAQLVATSVLQHKHENTQGVFSNIYITATPDGAVELYWCTQPDCKDAQLAQVVHFVVHPIDTAHLQVYRDKKYALYRGVC